MIYLPNIKYWEVCVVSKVPVLNVEFSSEGKQIKAKFKPENLENSAITKVKMALTSLARDVQTSADGNEVAATFAMDTKFVAALGSLSAGGTSFILSPRLVDIKRELKNVVANAR